jgi:hypothetical protein
MLPVQANVHHGGVNLQCHRGQPWDLNWAGWPDSSLYPFSERQTLILLSLFLRWLQAPHS